MWVTVYTDASFRDIGGWAVWIRSEKGRIVRSGQCPRTVRDSADAEMYAAMKAVEICLENWGGVSGIQINSDCMMVVNALYPWSKPIRRDSILKIQDQIRQTLKAKGIRIRCKHVKGHSGKGNTRSWLNTQVDSLAGKHT